MEMTAGTIVLKEGRIAKEFYVIENGLFRSFVFDYTGNEITTDFFGINEILIESFSLFQRTPSREYFESLSAAKVWKIEYDVFQKLLNEMEGLREWGRAWASTQLFLFKQRSIDIVALSATDRYLRLMKERPQIIRQAPLKYIASYLGVTDTSLSRIRREISRSKDYLP